MTPAWRVEHGDCLDVMRGLAECSVDSLVTDAPAGISFMGQSWDSDKGGRDQWIAWLAERTAEALRVLFGCVPPDTEILTEHGWRTREHLKVGDSVVQVDRRGSASLGMLQAVSAYPFNGEMVRISTRSTEQLLTPGHKVHAYAKRAKWKRVDVDTEMSCLSADEFSEDQTGICGWQLPLAARGVETRRSLGSVDIAALYGWVITEGHFHTDTPAVSIYQNEGEKADEIRALLAKLRIPHSEYRRTRDNYDGTPRESVQWYLKVGPWSDRLRGDLAGDKPTPPEWLAWLPDTEALALFEALVDGDGTRNGYGSGAWYQKRATVRAWFQSLCFRLGYRTTEDTDKSAISWARADSTEVQRGEHKKRWLSRRDFVRMVRLGWRPPGGLRLLVADPPCTPWSRAGKREGLADERDCLRETAELISILRPAFYLIGNVPGLQDSTSWHVVQDVIGGLAQHGYCVADYAQFDAADYGVPQHRIRPFWFGHRIGTPCIRWPAPTHGAPSGPTLPGIGALQPWVTCRQALQHLPLDDLGRPVRMKIRPKGVGGTRSGGDRSRCSSPDKAASTVVAAQGRKGGQILIPPSSAAECGCWDRECWHRKFGHPVPPSRREKAVHTSEPDEPARALTTQCRAPGHATTLVFSDRHPPATPDAPAGTIGAKDRGQSTVLVLGPADGRGTDFRHPPSVADEPSRTIKTNSERVGSGAALTWPWDRPATTVQRDERIAPPGHHDEWSIMSKANAVVLSERAAALLQGFPDGWVFSGPTKKARWSQIGMAMPPGLAEAVARAVREAMDKCDLIDGGTP